MVVYGKLKRKNPSYSNKSNLLSPTKHSFTESLQSLGDSSESLNSQSSNIFSTFTSDNNEFDEFCGTVDSTIEKDDIFTTTQIDVPQPSSPILKPRVSSALNSLFGGLEDIENEDNRSNKLRKTNEFKSNKTTFFQKSMLVSSFTTDDDGIESIFSDDDFSNNTAVSVQSLHNRIAELQKKVVEGDDTVEIAKAQPEIPTRKDKHYGGESRSFKAKETALSDEEDVYNDEELQVDKNNAINSKKCKSLDDLRSSRKQDNYKLDLEMITDQLDIVMSREDRSFDVLQLKIDIVTRLQKDIAFMAFVRNNYNEGSRIGYDAIIKLLRTNQMLPILNLQIILYFELNLSIEGLLSSLLEKPTPVKSYVEETKIPASKKLVTAMLEDWINVCSNCSTTKLIMTALSSTSAEYFLNLKREDRNAVLSLVNICLQSEDTELSLSYLKQIIHVAETDEIKPTLKLVVDLYHTLALSTTMCNSLLETIIVSGCTLEDSLTLDIIFSTQNWTKTWSIIDSLDVFNSGLNEHQQKQCLLAIGLIFSFIENDINIISTDTTVLRKTLMLPMNDEYTVLQLHCIGYLTGISHHFLGKFDQLDQEATQQIQKLCTVFRNSEVAFEDKLGSRIETIHTTLK